MEIKPKGLQGFYFFLSIFCDNLINKIKNINSDNKKIVFFFSLWEVKINIKIKFE